MSPPEAPTPVRLVVATDLSNVTAAQDALQREATDWDVKAAEARQHRKPYEEAEAEARRLREFAQALREAKAA